MASAGGNAGQISSRGDCLASFGWKDKKVISGDLAEVVAEAAVIFWRWPWRR